MRERITCGMLGTIMGLNPFKSAYKQFLIDTDQIVDEMTEFGKRKVAAGKALEEVIIKMYNDETGRSAVATGEEQELHMISHVSIPFVGKVDGWDNGFPIEVKNTTRDLGRDVETMNQDYYAQVQGYCLLLNVQKVIFCYLKDGWELIYFDVPRDEAFIGRISEALQAYFNCLLRCEYDETLLPVESKTLPDEVVENPALYSTIQEYLSLKDGLKELDRMKEDIKEMLFGEVGKLETPYFRLNAYTTKRTGALDTKLLQKKHPEIDLDQYRKDPSISYTVRIDAKEGDSEIDEIFA